MLTIQDESAPGATVGLAWIARQLGISARTVGRLHRDGLIPGQVRLPGHPRVVRFHRETVEAWLRELAR
ncbi:MAG TPA: helix-turn-helix domain-containing protein [Gemmataceae bacterium]|nr:helix-turn-helix domain-containing protein [Gemmataceae bacterium]